jgi:Na+/melibiose symporter-like transporter
MQEVAPALDPAARARGRRLAYLSHPACMTHRMVHTEDLPTLALVSLGAGEAVVGLQRSLLPLGQLLGLPTLRLVGRLRKRTILVAGHALAVLGGVPLLAFGALRAAGPELATPVVLASLAVCAAGIVVSNTVWFPLLRGYVEPDRTGHFFGLLRSGWHLALIVYFLAARSWLAGHPGSFAALFGLATFLGLLRIFLIVRLPERSEQTGAPIRVREAFRLLRTDAQLRRYLLGVGATGALRRSVVPFVIVMMRRQIGLTDAEVVLTTLAGYTGGLLSLYLWGRAVDRAGPVPVFLGTGLGTALLFAALLAVREPGPAAVAGLTAFFFLLTVFSSGFGVADTHVLFGLTPDHAPSRALVLGSVAVGCAAGLTPVLAGHLLETGLADAVRPVDRLEVYRSFFAGAALLQALAFLPLRGFTRVGDAGRSP